MLAVLGCFEFASVRRLSQGGSWTVDSARTEEDSYGRLVRWQRFETRQAASLQGKLLSNAGAIEQALGAGTGYVDHRRIGDDPIEDGLNGRDFDQLIGEGHFLHALELLV